MSQQQQQRSQDPQQVKTNLNTSRPTTTTVDSYPLPLLARNIELAPSSNLHSSSSPSADFLQQSLQKQRRSNFHSSSLTKSHITTIAMSVDPVKEPVNQTALHPGGVQPHIEHTELEEELHTRAHIDYDRVAIVS